MYKSPIEVKLDDIISNVVGKTDEYMMRCVQQVGVDVDKDELVKALEHDRRQYEKGYEDGWADAKKHGHWESSLTGWVYCSVCNTEPPDETNIRSKYCPNCGARMDEIVECLVMPKADGSTIPMEQRKITWQVNR